MAIVVGTKSIKYPNTFSLSQGITKLAEDIESVNESIKLILNTSKGELYGDPEYGCNLCQLLYDYEGAVLESSIKYEISNAINNYETRVYVNESDITVTYEGTKVKINIVYNLRNTDYRTSYLYITSIKEDSQ